MMLFKKKENSMGSFRILTKFLLENWKSILKAQLNLSLRMCMKRSKPLRLI